MKNSTSTSKVIWRDFWLENRIIKGTVKLNFGNNTTDTNSKAYYKTRVVIVVIFDLKPREIL